VHDGVFKYFVIRDSLTTHCSSWLDFVMMLLCCNWHSDSKWLSWCKKWKLRLNSTAILNKSSQSSAQYSYTEQVISELSSVQLYWTSHLRAQLSTAILNKSSQSSAQECHLLHGITQLPATRHMWTPPSLTPARGRYSVYLPGSDGRLCWPRWLVTYQDGLPAHRQSAIQVLTQQCTAGSGTCDLLITGPTL